MSGGRRWTPEQDALLRRLAGAASLAELRARLAEIGPHRTATAILCYADDHAIPVRPLAARLATREPSETRSSWTPEEDAVLRPLAGQHTCAEIALILNDRFGTARRAASIRNRARRLGLSLALTGLLSEEDLTNIFPCHNRRWARLRASWELSPVRVSAGRRGSAHWYRAADVERFIRARPHLFDWRRVKAGYWRDLVRAVGLRDPWLSVRDVSARSGVREATLHVWLASGLIPEARRAGEHRSAAWRVPASALVAVEQLAERSTLLRLERVV